MSTLEFRCLSCGHVLVVGQPIAMVGARPNPSCPACGYTTVRVYSPYAIIIK